MASYQLDWRESDILGMINDWDASDARRKMVDANQYYQGNNVTISLIKRMFWSDKSKKMMENSYVSNYRIGFGSFHDIVSQKVSTLLNEEPEISEDVKDPEFVTRMGYALKNLGTMASNCGVAFAFYAIGDSLTVFDSWNCIPFYDDETGNLAVFVRYWDVQARSGGKRKRFAEIYRETGMTRMLSEDGKPFAAIGPEVPYRYVISRDAVEGERTEALPGPMPIIELDNDKSKKSDMTPDIRSKIDMIDILQSGFANNIDDFAEVFWVVKNGAGLDTDEFADFAQQMAKTHLLKITGDAGAQLDAHAETTSIPVEARTKLIEILKQDLISDSGVLDVKDIASTQLTNVAIKAASMKLKQRVGDFEWEVYQAAKAILSIYGSYHSVDLSKASVKFTWLLVSNDTEIIDEAVKIQGSISKRSFLKNVQRAGYIDDVDQEIDQMDEESADKYSVESPAPAPAGGSEQ